MFYATTIKSVGGGGVVDTQGRWLTFLGYLPVKEGDTVYTDGRYIFGNAPPKGAPAVFDTPSGIPVLGDEYSLSTSDPKEELRGYVTMQGKYKNYAVADGDWITNDKKKFGHGDTEIDGKKIIDAGYSDDGDLYVATDGQYRENHTTKYNHHIYTGQHSGGRFETDKEHWVHAYIETYVGDEITLGVEADSIDASAVIYKNNEPITEFNLKIFADMVTGKSFEARDEIMSRSANMDADGNLLPEPPDGVNYIKQPPPPESFVAAVDARILTFKFDQQGEWDAIITASAYGYCFPFRVFNGSVLESTFTSRKPAFDNYLPDCINNLERYIFTNNYYPFLTLEKYPSFSGTRTSGGQYTEEFKKWCEDAIAYYIPLVRFKHFKWDVVAFGASMLIHVHSGEIVNIMQNHCGGGNEVYSGINWTELSSYSHSYKGFKIPTVTEQNDWHFPIGNGIFLGGVDNETGIFTCLTDKSGEKITDLPTFDFGRQLQRNYHFAIDAEVDETAIQIATPWGVDSSGFPIHIEAVADSLRWLPTCSYPDEYFNREDLKPYRFLIEFYDEKAKTDDSRDGLYRFNPSCEKLKGDRFLFGIYGEKLYLKTSDDWQVIGDGLKSFRLRELKKISKAKK